MLFSLLFSVEEARGSQPPLGEEARLSTVVLFRRLFQVVSLFKYFVSLVITSTHLSFGLVMFLGGAGSPFRVILGILRGDCFSISDPLLRGSTRRQFGVGPILHMKKHLPCNPLARRAFAEPCFSPLFLTTRWDLRSRGISVVVV